MTSTHRMIPSQFRSADLRLFWLPLAGLCIAIGILGDVGRDWLSFAPARVQSGEFWRLLSAHFCHLGLTHLALNVSGLALVAILTAGRLGPRAWWYYCVSCALATSAGLWWLSPEVQNYVGLSGVLHGLLVAGLLHGRKTGDRVESFIVLALVVAKLAYEQLAGPLPGSAATAGGAVIVDAHLYGALAGAAAWCLYFFAPRKLGN